MESPRGAAAREGTCPQARGVPPLGFPPPTLGAWALGGEAHQPTLGWFPSSYSPWGPPRQVAPPGGPPGPSGGPGTIPVTPKLVPMAKTALSIYNSLPPDHSETPRDVRDLNRDSEQHSGYCIYISSQP